MKEIKELTLAQVYSVEPNEEEAKKTVDFILRYIKSRYETAIKEAYNVGRTVYVK